MSQTSSGLDLFDEKASAVRGFTTVIRGYDKKAVDDYIRDVEQQLSVAKQRFREIQRELTAARLRNDDTDFSKLGAHTASLLKVAESQATDLVTKAHNEADAILSSARSRADKLRLDAEHASNNHRIRGVDELKALRAELEQQTKSELAAARTEAQGLRESADKHRAMVLADAEQQAIAILEAARAQAAHIVQTAEHTAAQLSDRTARETAALKADTASLVAESRTAAEGETTELRNRTTAELAAQRNSANEEVKALRAATASELAALRSQTQVECANARAAAKQETDALRAKVKAEVTQIRNRVADEVAALRDQAKAEADKIRVDVAKEREESLAALDAQQRALRDKLVGMVTEARTQSSQLQTSLEQASADLRARQQAALSDAERVKTDAIMEAAAIVAKAKSDADQHRQDTEGPLVKRAEQLTREQNLLRQRREALMAQLNNLSSLANLTALEFPDEDGNHPVHEVLTTEAVDDPVENTVERKPKADPSTTKANEDA